MDSVLFLLLAVPNNYVYKNMLDSNRKFKGKSCDVKYIKNIVDSLKEMYDSITSGDKTITTCGNLKNAINMCPNVNFKNLEEDSHEFIVKLFSILEMDPVAIKDVMFSSNDDKNVGNIKYVLENIKNYKMTKSDENKGVVLDVSSFVLLNPYYDSMDKFGQIISDSNIEGGYIIKENGTSEKFTRKVDITEYLPQKSKELLIIYLNRVGLDEYGIQRKINKKVGITETFEGKELYGIVSHLGGASGGHYISYFKYNDPKGEEKLWYIYDDMIPSIKRVGKGSFDELKNHRYSPEENGVLFFYK